jgi:hypothetical protein
MDEQPNPYEPPQVPAHSDVTPAKSDVWKFAILLVVMLAGVVSVVPWLAAILLVLSTPIYVRLWTERHKADAEKHGPSAQAISALATTGLTLGIVAAAFGAFLGTCSITLCAVAAPSLSASGLSEESIPWLVVGLIAGLIAGFFACVLVGIWLDGRLRPAVPTEHPPGTDGKP